MFNNKNFHGQTLLLEEVFRAALSFCWQCLSIIIKVKIKYDMLIKVKINY